MIKTAILSNGTKVVMEQITFVRSIALGFWVKNGSTNENDKNNGISHFMEHMLFKGTKNRTAKQIADEMDSIGGQLNAYTAKEYTCYYTRTLDTHFNTALDILSDMFFNSLFDDVEIKKELGVIIEEINMCEDTPDDLVHEVLQSGIWTGSSLSYPILGTEKTISTFDHNTFMEYYDENYTPENTVISIAGNFNEEEIINSLEKYFHTFVNKQKHDKQEKIVNYKKDILIKEKDIEQIHLCFGLPSIKIGTDKTYAVSIMNTIFGGGMSSRLFQKIREENGLAYSVYSYNSTFVDTGLFTIYAGLNPSHTEKVIELVIAEIKNMSKEKINEKQLYNTKEQIKSGYIMSSESTSSRMSNIGRNMLLLNKIITEDEVIKKIDNISLEDIDNIITEIFDLSKLSISAVGKTKGIDFKKVLDNSIIN